jgi:hypothetical protein
MKKPGRPSKFSADKASRILKAIRKGTPLKDAASVAGVSYDALNDWLNKGQREKAGVFRQFFLAYKRADAECVEEAASRVQTASQKNWQAAAWILERRRPEIYGRRSRLEHTGAAGVPIQTESTGCFVPAAAPLSIVSDEELEIAMRKYYAAKPDNGSN